MRKLSLLGLLAVLAMLLQGCLSAGIYRTARTLEPGRGDFGLTWNTVRVQTGSYTTIDQNGNEVTNPGTEFVYPNIIPELNYHIGVANNFELGGRLAPGTGYFELDGKFRFYRSANDQMHIAVQPAIGYSSFFIVDGVTITLPVIFTYDATKNVSLNFAPYGAFQSLSGVGDLLDGLAVQGRYVTGGVSVGMQLKGRKFYVMPSLDFARTLADLNVNTAEIISFPSQTYVRFGITLGWISGQELESLERIEDKLDRALEENEKDNGPPPPPDGKKDDDGEETPDEANTDPDEPDDTGPTWMRL